MEKIIRLNLFLSQKNCDKIYNLSNGQFYIIDIDNNHNPDNLIFKITKATNGFFVCIYNNLLALEDSLIFKNHLSDFNEIFQVISFLTNNRKVKRKYYLNIDIQNEKSKFNTNYEYYKYKLDILDNNTIQLKENSYNRLVFYDFVIEIELIFSIYCLILNTIPVENKFLNNFNIKLFKDKLSFAGYVLPEATINYNYSDKLIIDDLLSKVSNTDDLIFLILQLTNKIISEKDEYKITSNKENIQLISKKFVYKFLKLLS